jgi:chemotaxis signal transduction protein
MSAANQAKRFLVFTRGDGTYAVPERAVRTCLSLPRLTPLDDTAPRVIGAFDLHGELTPLISIADDPDVLPEAGCGDLVVVVEVGGHPVGLHADGLLGIEPLRAAPETAAELEPTAGATTVELLLAGGPARLVLPERLPVSASDAGVAGPQADLRLQTFERGLDEAELEAMARRSVRYSGLLGAGRR